MPCRPCGCRAGGRAAQCFASTWCTTVLITGFGPFPGVPVNATMRLVPELARAGAAICRRADRHRGAGTEWAAAPRRLERCSAEIEPDLVLHFGVSSRARGFEVEARARNACRRARCRRRLAPGRGHRDDCLSSLPPACRASYRDAAAPAGHPGFVARDAGGDRATPRSITRSGARGSSRAAASASSTSRRRSAGPAGPTAGASAGARSPGSRPTPAGSRSWPACLRLPPPPARTAAHDRQVRQRREGARARRPHRRRAARPRRQDQRPLARGDARSSGPPRRRSRTIVRPRS